MAIFDGDLKSMLEVKAKPVEVLGGDPKTVSKIVEKPLES